MQANVDSGYVVSGIKGKKLRNTMLIGLIVIVVGSLMILSVPSRYYFRCERGALSLSYGKLYGLVGTPVEGYDQIPVVSKTAHRLAGRAFDSVEDALSALRNVLEPEIRGALQKIAPQEALLAKTYETLLPNLKGARLAGTKGLDLRIQGLEAWMKMFHSSGFGELVQGKAQASPPPAKVKPSGE